MPSPWAQREYRASHPQPEPYTDALRRTTRCMADTLRGTRCQRGATVRVTTILGSAYCRTHGRKHMDRQVARLMNSYPVSMETLPR